MTAYMEGRLYVDGGLFLRLGDDADAYVAESPSEQYLIFVHDPSPSENFHIPVDCLE